MLLPHSANGTVLLGVPYGANLWRSTNFGATWTELTGSGSRTWTWGASSADGMTYLAVVDVGYVYTSVNGGTTWTERQAPGRIVWRTCAMSANGTVMVVAGQSNNFIWVSTDTGATWRSSQNTNAGTPNEWRSLTCSSDGRVIIAAGSDYLVRSGDYGVTWDRLLVAGNRNWISVTTNANGNSLGESSYELCRPLRNMDWSTRLKTRFT